MEVTDLKKHEMSATNEKEDISSLVLGNASCGYDSFGIR